MKRRTPEEEATYARMKLQSQIRQHHHTRSYHRGAFRAGLLINAVKPGKVNCDLSPDPQPPPTHETQEESPDPPNV